MTVELTVLIPIACTILGAAIGIATLLRNDKKNAADEAKNAGIIAEKLSNIEKGVAELGSKHDRLENLFFEMIKRMAIAERDLEKAHSRIDRMEGK